MTALPLRRGWCPGARRPMETGDGLLVRVHPPGGSLSAVQARALAEAAEACGNGLLDVTARGNLQIRGVNEVTHRAVLERLSGIALLEAAEDGPYRLTLVSPLAGIDPAEAFDAAALAAGIEARVGDVASALPAKFFVAIDGGGALRLEPGADVWVAPAEGGVAIGLAVEDGYVWYGPVPLETAAETVAAALVAFREKRGDARRMRDISPDAAGMIATAMAHATPLSFPVGEGGTGGAGDGWGAARSDAFRAAETAVSGLAPSTSASPNARPARPIRLGSAEPPSPTGKENYVAGFITESALLLALPFGRATAAQLRLAAGWAEAHGAGEIRLSFTRGILIPHLGLAAADVVARAAEAAGFVTDPADPRLALVACPGAPACGRGNTPAPQDALTLADAVRDLAEAGARIHVSACPKGCAHPRASDLTLVGRADGRYDVIPGGAAGDAPMTALPLPAVAGVLRHTSDPRGLAAAFGDHRT
ncbi:precorrin-3B synthase [Salinarimonas chemoclinalis]|uniref:precorrin-3B synthase n=1 Tax=Salinarimonas chemoclinalis TaxID=3241599 RepID=UPI0035573931